MTAPGPPLAGKLALVTGASRGIGLAVADELRAAGAHVVRIARSLTDGSAERQTDLPCDVADAHQVDQAVRRILTDHGVPDIVVNSAGSFLLKPVDQTTTADFAASIAVNLTGPFLVARALLPSQDRRSGRSVESRIARVPSRSGCEHTGDRHHMRAGRIR